MYSCSTNPIEVDYGSQPLSGGSFSSVGLSSILHTEPLSFWGHSAGYVYRIVPWQADSAGSILQLRASPPSGYNLQLFYDSIGKPSLLTETELYHIDSDERFTSAAYLHWNTGSWPHLYAVTEDSVCAYVRVIGDEYEIRRWNGLSTSISINDELTMWNPDSVIPHFAANSSYYALVQQRHTDSVLVKIYDHSRLIDQEFMFSDTDSVQIQKIFLLDNYLYMIIMEYHDHNFDLNPSFLEHTDSWRYGRKRSIVRKRVNGKWSRITGQSLIYDNPVSTFGNYYQSEVYYKNAAEVWIRNGASGYLVVTHNTVSWNSFRCCGINSYDLFTFLPNGRTVFYDEATQDYLIK
ncbi:MAG: hypothetical protein GF398_11370 [Chitinivibrionales bacterium]|nr:hypothetical protein [Chitinivibrionales bacterium]